jgi:hypothetical protein
MSYVILRVDDLVVGLPWPGDEQASLQFGTTRVLTLMDGKTLETQTGERRHEFFLMRYGKVQKFMRRTR